MNFGMRVLRLELRQFFVGGAQTGRARLGLLRLPADGNVVLQTLRAHVDADFRLFVLAELDRAQRGKILRVVRDLDQIFRVHAFG